MEKNNLITFENEKRSTLSALGNRPTRFDALWSTPWRMDRFVKASVCTN